MSTEPKIETTLAPEKKVAVRERLVVIDKGPLANLFDTARFEHMHRIASVMAGASLIPDHMWKDKTGPLEPAMVLANCFLVVNQAVRWGMDPFAVVPETYVVGGKLGFQGKLVAAVVNSRAAIKDSLSYSFSGTKGKDDFTVTVSGTFEGEDTPRTVTLSVGEAKTDNKMWTRDPEQKLIYSGATRWARRHCPEVILGVLTDDDAERMKQDGVGFDNAKVVPPIFPEPKAAPEPDKPAPKAKKQPETIETPAQTVTPLKEATHEVTKAPEGATTPQAGQQPASATPPASGGEDDPCAPLLTKIREAMTTYDITEADVLAFAKDKGILSPRNRMDLNNLSDNILAMIVGKLADLVAKFTESQKTDAP